MAGDPRGLSRRLIRTLFDAGTATGLTDGQLLERFATRRDEGSELAFATLVERHGPMVLRACRGILRDDHEAMDAFQATFLVLARKGGSLWVRDSIGPWLHRVACHAAGRARNTTVRRRAIERKAAEMTRPRSSDEDREELVSVIHEEVNRLPERYRSAVVLCDLEGRTCEEAARHLGCPVGTVGSRLSRARQRLRDRLSRRGLAPHAGLAAGLANGQGPREPMPSELVGSTAGAAARFVSIQAVRQGTAASLALGVLRAMTMTRWLKVASILLAVSASTSGVVALVGRDVAVADARPDDTPRADGVAALEVKPGKLSVVVNERGSLEAARSSDVFCMVEGQIRIAAIVPEGTRVTKGQLVCELDSAQLKVALSLAERRSKPAEAAYETARLAREVAELALEEYVKGGYRRDFEAALGEFVVAQSAFTKAEERLKRTRTARDRVNEILAAQGGAKTPADVMAALDIEDRLAAADQTLLREKVALEGAHSRKAVLEKFTRARTIKQLQVEIDKTRPVELARQESWESQKAEEAKLRLQVANCKIVAPADGIMVYANEPRMSDDGSIWQRVSIEKGTWVRERQKIFSIPDTDGPMRVNTKVGEPRIHRISPGLTAQVNVDAFPDETFDGVVEDVAPLPDVRPMFTSVYTTHVSFKGIPGLRPGMSAQVEILVTALDKVLSVPVQAVARYDNKDHVAVKIPDGGIDWREVTLGLANEKMVEVKQGLKAGETVAIEAAPLLSEAQKRKMPLTPTKPAQSRPLGPETDQGKVSILPPALRVKLQTLTPEDRGEIRNASPADREALLKKAGFTNNEILQYNQLRPRPQFGPLR